MFLSQSQNPPTSRSHIAVSESLAFTSTPKALIHDATSFTYARSAEELGFDPTVKRFLGKENMAQYQHSIGGRTYQTFEVLSNFRTAAIATRTTRVFKVKCVDGKGKDDGEGYAIKDLSTVIDAKTEEEIQGDIFAKVNKVNPAEGLSEEEMENRKSFMKIRDCEVVQAGDSQPRKDASKAVLHVPKLPSTGLLPDLQLQHDLTIENTNIARSKNTNSLCYWTTGGPRLTGSSLKHSGQLHGTSVPIRGSARHYEMKKQVRVVFEDVGVPLAKLMLKDQPTFFMALADAMKGLLYFYSAHYVHRDISDRNVLFCDGVGKISDLEYAIKYHSDVDGSENMDKFGTPAYMSIEVNVGLNLFLPNTLTGEIRDIEESDDSDWDVDGEEDKLPGATAPRPSFIQHYLNDVESLWWVATFSQTSTVPMDEYNDKVEMHEQDATPNTPFPFYKQITCHTALFNNQAFRSLFFRERSVFETHVRHMPQTTQKSTFRALRGAREDLINFYMAFEKDFSAGPKTHFIYEHMARWMRRAAKVSSKHVTPLKQMHSSITKRKTVQCSHKARGRF